MLLSIDERIRQAYLEDLPNGDLTTDTLFAEAKIGHARLVAKDDLVLSQREIFERAIHHIAEKMELSWQFNDGDFVLEKQTVCLLRGDLVKLLRAERVALNLLGHFCGIATLTRCFVNPVKHTKCKILDTRKTTPMWRDLEKAAVRDGGGSNHRMNLSAAVLIKENHIRAAGSLRAAVQKMKSSVKAPVEVECSTLEEVKEAVNLRVNRILLDNMTNESMAEALKVIPALIETEASGNMHQDRVGSVAELGVDFISVGAITHSAPCADLSLLFDWSSRDI